jgi:hypothetical protein
VVTMKNGVFWDVMSCGSCKFLQERARTHVRFSVVMLATKYKCTGAVKGNGRYVKSVLYLGLAALFDVEYYLRSFISYFKIRCRFQPLQVHSIHIMCDADKRKSLLLKG